MRVFCPNCGTQNEDTANNCTKCGFNLKGTAAPKFKGTMLMMNVPPGLAKPAAAAVPTAPTDPAPAPAPAAPAPAAPAQPAPTAAATASAAAKAKLKGTMLGVAPPSPGAAPVPPFGTPLGGPPGGISPAAGFPAPSPAAAAPAAAAPAPAAPTVNPLGGTMVADAASFGSPGAYGSPPAAPAPAWGAPPAQSPPNFGAPAAPAYDPAAPAAFPNQPQAGGYAPGYAATQANPSFEANAGSYGQPQPGGYGSGAGPSYGSTPQYQGGALSPYGADPLAPTSPGGHGPVGKIRNPVNDTIFGAICGFYALFVWIFGILELSAFRQKKDINILFLFIPILNLIFLWQLTGKVLDAKQMAGVPNAQVGHPIMYFIPIYGLYAFIVDLNEIFRAASGATSDSYG